MIPNRLLVKDFLSYVAPDPLDLTGFEVACVSGDNGAGKSALLDAITWACFGAARGCESGQNQDRLIRDGCDETMVDFTFSVADATYRIVRRRSRSGKAELQFLVADGEAWRNIAAESLRQTEAKIGSVLRMDYRTFTASAFFLQGRSEDFLARMRPDERKDVFARLLDLGTYERLEDAARMRAREADARRKELARRIEELAASAPDVAHIERGLEEVEKEKASAVEEVERAGARIREARDALSDLEVADALLETERRELAATETSAQQARDETAKRCAELAVLDELLGRADEVANAVDEAGRLRSEDAHAHQQKDLATALERRCAEIVATLDADRRRIEQRVEDATRRLTEVANERTELEADRGKLAKIDAALDEAGDLAASLDAARAERNQQEVGAARLEEQMHALDEIVEKATRSLEVLAGGGGECPVCGSALDRAHRAEAKRRLQDDIRDAKTKKRSMRADADTARKEVARSAEEIKRLEAAGREHTKLVEARTKLASRLDRLPVVEEQITAVEEEVSAQGSLLTDDAFGADLKAELERIDRERREAYDAVAHERILERLKELQPYEALAGRIDEASRRRGPLAHEIEEAEARAERLDVEIEERRRTVATLIERTEGLDAARTAAADHQRVLDKAQVSLSGFVGDAARLQERLETARRLAEELETARASERAAATDHRRFRRLTEAFGRGGIPDRIIDNALPELEDDANRILGGLTDHEMSVRFVLQRETKSGKAKETFEALVHHEGAVRDFSMFSGGEAFRIAFAVRLAMSKLLVRRAGARLETLVIDEGFGSQDPAGRERLIEAVNIARGEFAKILVITHLDELKDQFGGQIHVEKGPEGSLLTVVGA